MNTDVSHQKLVLTARYWLLGMAAHDSSYYKVLDAMEYMLQRHTAERNGGDIESVHQLRIFQHLRTLHNHISSPQVKYMAAFLHDTVEDKNVSVQEIEALFGAEVAYTVDLLSKEVLGVKKDLTLYLPNVFKDENASVVKLGDRNDNISTMVGVFKPERLLRYFNETKDEYLPRIKEARRRFPHQEAAYENLKLGIANQLKLIQTIIKMQEAGAEIPSNVRNIKDQA